VNSTTVIVEQFDGFPSLSITVSKIVDLFNRGAVDISILEKELLKDPNLTIQVLKIANSPFFGISGEVTSIKDACMIIGLSNVFNLVTAADVINLFSASNSHLLDSVGFWEHSISTGIAISLILKKIKHEDSNAFIVGLLHDIGKLALDYYQPDIYEKILNYQEKNICTYVIAEKSISNYTHSELGAEIIKHWNLNDSLAKTIYYHHDGDSITKSRMLSALHVADLLVKGLDIGEIDENQVSEFYSRSLGNLGLKFNDMYELMNTIEKATKDNSLLELIH